MPTRYSPPRNAQRAGSTYQPGMFLTLAQRAIAQLQQRAALAIPRAGRNPGTPPGAQPNTNTPQPNTQPDPATPQRPAPPGYSAFTAARTARTQRASPTSPPGSNPTSRTPPEDATSTETSTLTQRPDLGTSPEAPPDTTSSAPGTQPNTQTGEPLTSTRPPIGRASLMQSNIADEPTAPPGAPDPATTARLRTDVPSGPDASRQRSIQRNAFRNRVKYHVSQGLSRADATRATAHDLQQPPPSPSGRTDISPAPSTRAPNHARAAAGQATYRATQRDAANRAYRQKTRQEDLFGGPSATDERPTPFD